MSIMEKLFGRTASQVPAPNPAPPASNNPAANAPTQQTQVSGQTDPNGTVPAGSNEPASPLSKFEKVWEPNKDAPKEQSLSVQNVDPNKIMEAAGKIDFASLLSKEDLAKVAAGGEEAVAAMASLLNKTAQSVYGQAAFAATKIQEKTMAEAEERFLAKLPGLINQRSAQELLLQNNKQLSHPAVKPIVDMMREQLVQQYPNATAAQIAEMTQEMMKGAAQVFNPIPPADATKGKKQDEDWEAYVNS